MSELPGEEIPVPVQEYLHDLTQEALVGAFSVLAVRLAAWARVEEEHPHWFIEYSDPRNPKEKLALRNRRGKELSRAKKRYYAVEAIVNEEMAKLGFGGEAEALVEVVRDAATTHQFKAGTLDEGKEVEYLEGMLSRPSQLEPTEQ